MSQRPEYELLGSTAESIHTKYKGLVTGIQYNLSSAPQVHVQMPVGKDGKIPDAMLFDIHVCKFTNKLAKTKLPAVEDFNVELGDAVEDIVSGFVGICTVIACGLNGCVEIQVIAKVNNDMKAAIHMQNHKRFRVTKPGKVVIPQSTVEAVPSKSGAVGISSVGKRNA